MQKDRKNKAEDMVTVTQLPEALNSKELAVSTRFPALTFCPLDISLGRHYNDYRGVG